MSQALRKALAAPEVRDHFASLGFEPGAGTPADLRKAMVEDTRRWGPVVKKSGFRAD